MYFANKKAVLLHLMQQSQALHIALTGVFDKVEHLEI
jgi:hypothetical protein